MRHEPRKCEEPPCQAAPSEYRTERAAILTHPRHAGILLQLAAAEDKVLQAESSGCWLAARLARREANVFRKRLRPAPVEDWRHVEAERLMQVRAIARWAAQQSGGGR